MIDDLTTISDNYIDKLIKQIKLIKAVCKETNQFHSVPGDSSIIEKAGIYINSNHLMIEGYDFIFVNSYELLYQEVFNSRENIFTKFALRTLWETSFLQTQMLFEGTYPKEQLTKYKVFCVIVDLTFIARNREYRFEDLNGIVNTYASIFKEKERKILDDILEYIKKNPFKTLSTPEETNLNHLIFEKHHKQLRKRILQFEADFENKFFKYRSAYFPPNMLTLKWTSSHLLHGNTTMIGAVFSERGKIEHRHQVRWALILCGTNFTHFLMKYLHDEKITTVQKDIHKEYLHLKTLYAKLAN